MSLLSVLGGIGKTALSFVTGGPVAAAGTAASSFYNTGGARSGAQNNPPLPQLPQLPPLGGVGTAVNQILNAGYQSGQAVGQLLLPSGGTPVAQYQPSVQGPGIPSKYGVLSAGEQPTTKTKTIRKCRRGYALATDGKCYPKAMLPRWARAWKPEPRPVVSRADQKAIRRADHARHRLVKLTKAAGAHASMHAPKHCAVPRKRR